MHYRHGVSSFWRRDLREIYRSGCQVTFSKSEKDLLYALQAKWPGEFAKFKVNDVFQSATVPIEKASDKNAYKYITNIDLIDSRT